MPIDAESHLGKWTNHVANGSIIGRVMVNPLWMTFIVVAVTLLIYSVESQAKSIIYSSACVLMLLLAHDGLFEQQQREKYETLADQQVVLGQHSEVVPRGVDTRPENFNPVTADELDRIV